MGGPPKPRLASPANMSKRGLSARHYASNQTLITVNTRLPMKNLKAGNDGGPTPELFRKWLSASINKTARLRSQTGGFVAVGAGVGTPPGGSGLRTLRLGLTILGRGRARPMLRHELVELFLVLGVAQAVEEVPEFGLFLFEAPQGFRAVFVERAVAA